MRQFIYTGWILILCGFIVVLNSHASENRDLSVESADLDAQVSYALGLDIVEQLKKGLDLNLPYFLKGAQDAVNGTPQFSEEKLKFLLQSYQSTARNRQIEKIKQESEKNQLAGEAWLLENSIKQGVKTLSSGLQYKVLKAGDGETPQMFDTVECNYRGMLIDGTIFESSFDRGEAAVFDIKDVIKGWQIALQKMKVGSRWMIYIPADMAYGEHGAGQVIRPGMTLIFEIELLQILE